MRDDYLWDGSGEPDPEIEKLEGLLGRFKSERPAPELPETPVVPFRPRRAIFAPPYAAAAAAALLLSVLLGVWLFTRQNANSTVRPQASSEETPVAPAPTVEQPERQTPAPAPAPKQIDKPRIEQASYTPRPRKAAPTATDNTTAAVPPAVEPARKIQPLVDLATADHIEQAELLLRSFRNASAGDKDALVEVAFDSRQSRDLLDRNILLRRSAETKKNLPVGQLLGDLEPFLIDIANLGSEPSRDDVQAIQQRMERREIVSDLELYSVNRTAQGF